MMRYAFVVVLLAALLAAACKDSEPPAKVTPSPAASAVKQPEPMAPVPEGMLLVQESNPIGYPRTFSIEGSEVREMTKGPLLSVAPDGRHLAAIEQDAEDYRVVVRIFDADGEETFVARAPEGTRSANPYFTAPVWSPDGSQVAYALPEHAGSDLANLFVLFVVNADGSGDRLVTQETEAYVIIGWTGDGRVLVDSPEAGLVVMGAKRQTLPMPEGQEVFGEFQLSPDGRSLAFLVGNWDEGFEVWVMDVASGKSRRVADMGQVAAWPAPERYVSAGLPLGAKAVDAPAAMMKGPPPVAWSPDGSRIAYYRNETSAADTFFSELRVVNIETGEDVSVTESGSWQASWSPDGRYLAEPAHDDGKVLLLRPDGTTTVLDVQGQTVTWSEDGTLVAATAGGIALVDPATGEVREVLVEDGGNFYGAQIWEPVWSPDGRYLALATSEDPGRNTGSLYVLDTQTSEVTTVLETGSFHPVAWLSD